MNEYTITMRVHLPLLKRQKQALLRAISNAHNAGDTVLLDGILNLLDYIHDTIDPPDGAPREDWMADMCADDDFANKE